MVVLRVIFPFVALIALSNSYRVQDKQIQVTLHPSIQDKQIQVTLHPSIQDKQDDVTIVPVPIPEDEEIFNLMPNITEFRRLGSLYEYPQYPPQPKVLSGQTPPIQPRQSSSCSNVQYSFSTSGQSAYLQSQNYPSNYPYNQDCSYFISSPAGTRMTISCSINVACPNDYIFFSLDGSSTFSGAKSYCGNGNVASQTTTSNQLSVGFHSGSRRSFSFSAYQYQCTISVVGTQQPTTTTQAPAPSPVTAAPPSGSCSCGTRNVNGASSKIVGGTQTKAGEIPWRVTVFVYDPTTGQGGLCGGTIISPNWVMTAAHCTMDFKQGYKINVYTGAQANPVTVGGGTTVVADRYIQHPSFSRSTLDNDITLLHLSKPLTFAPNVSPACLPFGALSTSEFSGATVLASGWGTTKPVAAGADNNDSPSSTLMEVFLPILTTAQCQQYQSVTANQICTYQPGKDTCQGDSGGSIDYQYTNGRYYSIGVVSYGIGCAQTNYPGVYTKVTKYLSWIQSNTGDTFCQP